MTKFWTMLDGLLEKMKTVGAICLAGMVAVTCIGVVGRIFNHPVFGTEEMVSFLSTIVIAMTLPYAHRAGIHIGVEILVRLFSKKHQDRIKLFTDLISLALFAVVTWRMFLYARSVQESGVVSMNLAFPEYTIIYALAFCFFIFTLFVLRDVTLFFRRSNEE
ncbi:MAG: TRAP transporter small permease [Pseudomonadota bacterium]